MFKYFLTIILIAQNSSQKCSKGCLKCSPLDECLLCNQNQNYILKENTCIKNKIENCSFQNSQGKCLNCISEYFLEKTTQKCISFSETEKIENCIQFSDLKNCSQCYKHFFLKDNKCIKIENEIENCIIYLNEEKCLECESEFILNENNSECGKINFIDNCVGYGNLKCSECDADFFYNENLYLGKILNSQENFNWAFFEKSGFRLEFFRTEMELCSKKTLSNCVFFKDFNKCKKCEENYFVNEDEGCSKNPDPVIDNCFIYKNSLECEFCDKGFYLKSSSDCEKNIEIINCLDYSRNSNLTKCESCQKDFYLENNECKKRSNIIEFCLLYKLEKDSCEFCQENKILINQGLICADQIGNCLEYYSTKNECKTCKEKHILKNKNCILGTIDGCRVYQKDIENENLEVCTFCENDRYLNNNKCEKHNEITGCILYDYITPDYCKECNKNSFLLYHKNICKEVDSKIENCEDYLNNTTCGKCEVNYFLENNKCLLIPQNTNCEDFSNFSKCSKCKTGYILSYEKCFTPSFLFTNNCLEKNYKGGLYLHQGKCDICEENSLPFNIKNNYYCLEPKRTEEVLPNLINYCVGYFNDGLNTYCSKCKMEYILMNNECILIDSCDESVIPFLFDNFYEIKKMKECKNLIEGCDVVVPNNINPNFFECSKCKSTYNEKIIDFFEDDTNFIIFKNVQNLEENIITENPVNYHPRITCKQSVTNLYIKDNIIDNCYYYINLAISNKLGCIRCKNGYKGKVEKFNNEFFIKECIIMEKCDNSSNKGGLSKNIDKLFSCQICKDYQELPTLFINSNSDYNGINGLQTYDNDFNNSEIGGETVKCLKPTKTDLKITGDFSIPENCSHLIYNINSNKDSSNSNQISNIDKTKISVFCTSCKPGFKKIKSLDNSENEIKNFAGRCESIENCDGLLWFNNCSKCKNGYIWKYDINKGVDYSTCIPFEGNNCLAAEYKFPQQTFCSLCKKGFMNNIDGKCFEYIFIDCNIFHPFLNLGKKDLQTKLFFYFYLNGCQNCYGSDYNLFLEKEDFNLCLFSGYTLNLPEETNFIKNCLNYYNEFPSKCFKCINEFILEENQYECISSNMDNCEKIRKSTMECILCSEDYIPMNGICEKKNIENCKEYLNNSDTQKCLKCKNGYYQDNFKCVIGNIKSCELYEGNGQNCKKCFDHFILIPNYVGKNYCVPSIVKENCSESVVLQNGILQCLKCTNNNYLFENENERISNSCIQLNTIENCLRYHITNNLIHSSLDCLECNKNYYLRDKICKSQITIQNCLIYSNSDPKCETCSNSFYYNNLTNNCVENPKGIQNCKEYSSAEKCHLCKKDYFIYNNKCIKIDNKIENCSIYYDQNHCKICENGYLNKSTECLETKITNCAYLKDNKNCQKCLKGFYLEIIEDETRCIMKKSPLNCSIYDFEKKICEQCNKNLFFNKDSLDCEEVSEIIDNCEFYEEDVKCSKCKEKFVLSVDQTVCKDFGQFNDLIDQNCKFAFLTSENNCEICLQGYYKDFISKKCLSCHDLNCAFCNPVKPVECYICKENSYQNYKGQCISIKKDVIDSDFVGFIKIFLQNFYIFFFVLF